MKDSGHAKQLEQLLWVLSAATFLIFFQAYMVAPLIPRLSQVFAVSARSIGLVVPAYMIPYGVALHESDAFTCEEHVFARVFSMIVQDIEGDPTFLLHVWRADDAVVALVSTQQQSQPNLDE